MYTFVNVNHILGFPLSAWNIFITRDIHRSKIKSIKNLDYAIYHILLLHHAQPLHVLVNYLTQAYNYLCRNILISCVSEWVYAGNEIDLQGGNYNCNLIFPLALTFFLFVYFCFTQIHRNSKYKQFFLHITHVHTPTRTHTAHTVTEDNFSPVVTCKFYI